MDTSEVKQVLFLNRVMFVLAIAGIIMAAYVLQSFLRQSPIVCLNEGCELVRKSSASKLFGIPVPAFGLIGYSLLAILSFLRTTNNDKRFLYGILGIGLFGVSFVSWFTYTELFIIKAVCTWCAVSAVNMTIIFILAMISWHNEKSQNSMSKS